MTAGHASIRHVPQGRENEHALGDLINLLEPTKGVATKTWNAHFDRWALEGYTAGAYYRGQRFAHENTDELFGLLRWAAARNVIYVSGKIRDGVNRSRMSRRKTDRGDDSHGIEDQPTRLIFFDCDRVEVPVADPFNDPEDIGEYLRGLLPAEFQDVRCLVQLSASCGITEGKGRDPAKTTVSARLYFRAVRPVSQSEAKRLAQAVNQAAGRKVTDPTIYAANQPIYIANPHFLGAVDPLPRRVFELPGLDDEVVPVIPDRIDAEWSGDGSSYAHDAGGWLERIGDQSLGLDGFQEPIKFAIHAAVREQDDDVDWEALREAIQQRVRENAGSRSRNEVERYCSAAFLDDKLAWSRDVIRESERKAAAEGAAQVAAAQARIEAAAPPATNVIRLSHTDLVAAKRDHVTRALRSDVEAAKRDILARHQIEVRKEEERARINIELEQKFGQGIASAKVHPHYAAFRTERRKRYAAAARRVRKQVLAEFGLTCLASAAPAFLHKTFTGSGKTRAAGQIIAEDHALPNGFDLFEPRHTMTGQELSRIVGMNPAFKAVVDRGRAARDPQSRCTGRCAAGHDADAMCPRHQLASLIGMSGQDVKSELCASCPYATFCGYLADEQPLKKAREEGGTVIGTHAHAVCPRRVKAGDIQFFDENALKSFKTITTCKLALLRDDYALTSFLDRDDLLADQAEVLGRHAEVIHQAIAKHLDDYPHRFIREQGITRSSLKRCNKLLEKGLGRVSTANAKSDAELIGRFRERLHDGRFALLALFRAVLANFDSDAKAWLQCRLTGDVEDPTISIVTYKRPRVPKRTAIFVLDATADPQLCEGLFGRPFKITEIPLPENVAVTQVLTTGSMQTVLGFSPHETPELADLPEAERRHALACQDGILSCITNFTRTAPSYCFIAQKELIKRWRDRLPGNPVTLHFNALSGQNDAEDQGTLVLVGRVQPKVADVQQDAAAIAAITGEPVFTKEDWLAKHSDYQSPLRDGRPRRDGWLDRPDGKGGYIDEPWHPCDLVYRLLRQVLHAELMQALGRVRSHNRDEPTRVLYFGKIPLEGIANVTVVSIREARRGKCRNTALGEYLRKGIEAGRVILLDKESMSREGGFRNENSAREALKLAGTDEWLQAVGLSRKASDYGDIREINSGASLIVSMRDAPLFPDAFSADLTSPTAWHWCTYRRPGQRRPSKALVPNIMSAAEARTDIEARLGVAIQDFAILAEKPGVKLATAA